MAVSVKFPCRSSPNYYRQEFRPLMSRSRTEFRIPDSRFRSQKPNWRTGAGRQTKTRFRAHRGLTQLRWRGHGTKTQAGFQIPQPCTHPHGSGAKTLLLRSHDGAGVFNLLHTFFGGILVFCLLYAFARWATRTDPLMLRFVLNSAGLRVQYDPVKFAPIAVRGAHHV